MKSRIWSVCFCVVSILCFAQLRELLSQELPRLPEFPPINYDGITATSPSQQVPSFGSPGYTSADYQALYENLTDWKGLTDGGEGLVLTVDLSRFDRPLHPGLLSASSNNAGQVLWLTGGTNPAWQSNVSETALYRLKGIQRGRSPKAHGVFDSDDELDEIFFYARELEIDLDEFFITPFSAGKTAGSPSAQASKLTSMLDYGRITRGFDIRNLEIVSEPYGMTSAQHINYQKEGSFAIKNWFEANAPGVPFQVKLSASRATVDNNNEGNESTGLFLADVLRPFSTVIDLHAYVFGRITRGDFDHQTSNIRDWAVGDPFGMANRVAHFAKLGRNEYGRPFDDTITRWVEIGEWSAPKNEYVGDYATSGDRLSRDGGVVFRGMVGVMYKYLFLQELSKIPNVRNACTWADVAGTMSNDYAKNYPKTGNGQMIWKNDDNVTFAHYWGLKTMQDHWGAACPVVSGTTPFAPAGKPSGYYFGTQGPDVIGPFPVMVPHVSVSEAQDKLYVIVANTDLATSRGVDLTLNGRDWGNSQLVVTSATIIKAIENNTRDTWTGGRMEHGKLDAHGGEIGGPGKFVDDYSTHVALCGNVVSWSDQPPFSIVYVEVGIHPAESLLENNGFEDSLAYWSVSGAPGIVSVEDSAEAAAGDWYLSCSWRTGDGDVAPGVSQVVDSITGGEEYIFAWKVWLNDMGVAAGLRVTWLDSLDTPLDTMEIGLVTGTSMGWINRLDTLQAPGSACRVRVYVGFMDIDESGTSNEARFDEVQVRMVPLTDRDQDGIPDKYDNCPSLANSDQMDTDNDSEGDECDLDDDGDGVGDTEDAFPLDSTETADTDSDGVGDNADNCLSVANSDQLDTDDDGEGDACDDDDDGDGTPDAQDAFPLDKTEDTDTDGDGIGNNADDDDDGDGVLDEVDPEPLNPDITAIDEKNLEREQSFTFWPNPAYGKLNIMIPAWLPGDRIIILDPTGRVFMHEEIKADRLVLEIGNLMRGLYFIRYENELNREVHKFIKQ